MSRYKPRSSRAKRLNKAEKKETVLVGRYIVQLSMITMASFRTGDGKVGAASICLEICTILLNISIKSVKKEKVLNRKHFFMQ